MGEKPQSVGWNNEIKAAVRRKETAWKGVLATNDEETKERGMEAYREDTRKDKKCIIQSKKKVNEPFRREINEDVNGIRKLFWKEVSNEKRAKVESCSRVKDGSGRLAQREDEARKICII